MRRVAALALAGSMVLAGCVSGPPDASASASPSGSIDVLSVGVDEEDQSPTIDFAEGQVWDTAETTVVWNGDGDHLEAGQPLLLDMYGVSLEDGAEVIDTYEGFARSYVLAPEILGEDLYNALLGVRVGARILHVSPAPEDNPDEEPPIAVVVDVLPTRAVGNAVEISEDLPQIALADDGTPTVTIPKGLDKPADLQVVTTIQGTGQQVREGDFVKVNFTMVNWKGKELESSWPDEIAPLEVEVGSGDTISAIEDGLLDQTVGSQLMIMAPATLAYPDKGAVVIVVDILDAFTPQESE